ncbi:MAG: M23 family metallopeptidase [Gemmatimonadota bacterium]|nr:M23 family metallopeptidase [Gemmatimonadota bacterium]
MKTPSYWTIQVLPEGSGSSHSYRLRKRTAVLAVAGVLALAGLTSAFFVGMLGSRDALDEVNRYRAENEQLIATLDAMETRSQRLGLALDDMAAREQRFRVVAGLPLIEPEVYSVGVGGPGGGNAVEALSDIAPDLAMTASDVSLDLDELVRRADLLSASLSESVESVELQRDQFRRIPAIWPVVAENSWISSGFSHNRMHPLLGYRRPHPGVDISADFGSPVVASGAGRVVAAGQRSGYGRMVEVDHGDGYVSRYAHLASLKVRVGAEVDRGDVLGEVGRSGLATGPNLHYEVIRDGRPENPFNYLLDDRTGR